MEDTDEDFFDKLVDDVDDQFKITSSSLSSTTVTESSVINRSDEAKANSGIGDGRNTVKELRKEDDNNNNKVASTISTGVTDDRVDPGQSLVSSNSYVFDNVVQYHGTGDGSGVKEVQWSAFTSEPLDNTSNVFGSYSDFFTEFDSNLVDSTGKGDNFVNSEADSVGNSSHVESVVDYSHQFQESQSYTTSGRQSTDGQDLNSTQYWENLYPGWKYDANTGQWYQIDESYDATLNAQIVDNSSSASDWTVSNVKTEATNLQKTSQCFVGEKSPNENVTCWSPNSQTSHTNESLSNWSQTSQGNNNGYPPHMYFDPQYPGWYYDMNIQEWRGLDAYNSQLTDQNSFSASNSYYGNEQLVGKQQGWQPETVNIVNQYQSYGANFREDNNVNQQQSYDYGGTGSSFNKSSQSQSFGSSANFSQPFGQSFMEQNEMMNATKAYGSQNQLSHSQQSVHQNGHQKRYGSTVERSSAGQPPHALATFGFGGKLIVMKNTTAVINASYGGQDSSARSISVLNLAEVVTGVGDVSSSGTGVHGYFHTLCRQSFPGPLAGGNVSSKDLNRWIDERITHPTETDYKKDQVLRLLLSLLKIASQHYGKLRSPFGTDTTTKENDAPDVAVARLFASAKKNSAEYGNFGSFVNCLQQLPSEGQTRATAAEVQTLLVSGRKMEALHRAQEGQLWGLALVLAAQLGDQFYMDTVRNMALRQLAAGSPLRTLCLLIAGQPADVFSTDITADDGTVNMFQQPTQAQLGANAMLDDWEENLAMITANRTKDDELVLIHLGDCLWKETSNIIAAHICYLVAEANFEPYSDSARLCLIGADHWKHPRTYACPEAIQRTEVYEYSKLLGNSQFTLLPFQPYKLIYANMLAEVGRVSDSLKYCQVISKSLKTGRAPEVETWRHLVISLEERIKAHQQGGFSTNLAPGKLVGKLLNLFDSTAHRVVGGLPPPVPSSTSGSSTQNDHYHQPTGPRVSSSQSTMAMSSLVPSASMEPITQKSAEGNNRRTMHNRSVSEPDFSRSPRQKQVDSSKENSGDSQSKTSTSRFGRLGFGSQLFQKTVGLVLKPRQDKQAKLGETNKFYFDEKLKRWVEEGVDPPAEEPALAPPPRTMTSFQTSSDYASKSASKSEGSLSNGSLEFSSGNTTVGHSSGIPPIPASSSQFSARGRMGVRARYVDTFNQGGGNTTKLFQSPSASPIKPVTKSNPKFFVPKAVPSVDQPTDTYQENTQQQQQQTTTVYDETHSPTSKNYNPFQPPSYQSSMQRFASMDDISKGGIIPSFPSTSSSSPHSRRTVSWGGSTDERFTVSSSEMKPNGEVLGIMPQKSFMPSDPPVVNGDGFNDDLHEVEL